jgi:hypothetical protein
MEAMSFDQREFLDEHIPYRLGNLELFYHALRVKLSEPAPQKVKMIFDTGHEIQGPYWIFTNLATEAGILVCRTLLEFLEAKPKYKDDVLITMFKHLDGRNLRSVSLSDVAKFHPPDFSESKTLEALKFTRRAADKAVAHLTLGPSQEEEIQRYQDEEIQRYQVSCLAIRAAIEHYLYEKLGHPVPPRIIEDVRRGELDG